MAATELKNVLASAEVVNPAGPKFTEMKSELADKLQNELTFGFEFTSTIDNKVYVGTFRAKRLTLGGFGQMKVQEARLNGGQEPTADARVIHNMLAYCRVTLLEYPEWWAPEEFYDLDILGAVHDHVRHWENSFRRSGVGG